VFIKAWIRKINIHDLFFKKMKLNNIKFFLFQHKNRNILNEFLKITIYILLIILVLTIISGNLKISIDINGELDIGNQLYVKIIEDPEKIMKRSSY